MPGKNGGGFTGKGLTFEAKSGIIKSGIKILKSQQKVEVKQMKKILIELDNGEREMNVQCKSKRDVKPVTIAVAKWLFENGFDLCLVGQKPNSDVIHVAKPYSNYLTKTGDKILVFSPHTDFIIRHDLYPAENIAYFKRYWNIVKEYQAMKLVVGQ